MNNMRRGFTMIELIFVIVIIGILAAVAIPKLAGTRTDAKISSEVASLKQLVTNLGAEFTSQNKILKESVVQANASLKCFEITPKTADITDGNFTVTPSQDSTTACDAVVFAGVKTLAAESNLIKSDESAKEYQFGGATIVR